MSYAERRKGKLTGWWYGEAEVRSAGTEHRFRKRFATKGEADGYEAYVRATGEEPPHLVEAPVSSFATTADRCKQAHPEWGRRDPSALQRLDWVCGQIGKLDIKAISTAVLREKIVVPLRAKPGKREGSGLDSRTINRYLDTAAKVLRFAAEEERSLPQGMPKIPRGEDKGNRIHTLSFEQEDTLVNWIVAQQGLPGFDRAYEVSAVIRFLASAGLRRGELWKLRAGQIEDGWVTLEPDQTKTNAARRVYVDPEIARPIRAMVATGTLPKAWQVYRIFKAAVKACGYAEELTLHSLRHTTATRYLKAGVDVLVTAEALGHASLSTTRKYAHVDQDLLAEAAKKVHQSRGEKRLGGSVVPFAQGRDKADVA